LDEVIFREQIFKLREEFTKYVNNDLHKEDRDFVIFDESEEADAELFDNFYYPIDIHMSCANQDFIYTNREFYFFLFILLLLLYNGYCLLGILYFIFGMNMAYAAPGDDAELENEAYYFTMDKFLKKVFSLLDKISKRKLEIKDQSLLIIDSEDLFDFVLDQTFYSNNVDLYITDIELPEI